MPEMKLTDYMYQEKEEEENLPALKTALLIDPMTRRLYRKEITTTRNNIDNTRINRMEITRKQKWEGKQMYGRFKRRASDISYVDVAKKGRP